jgi:hypothetical protein
VNSRGYIWLNLAKFGKFWLRPFKIALKDAQKTGTISTCPDLNLIEPKMTKISQNLPNLVASLFDYSQKKT